MLSGRTELEVWYLPRKNRMLRPRVRGDITALPFFGAAFFRAGRVVAPPSNRRCAKGVKMGPHFLKGEGMFFKRPFSKRMEVSRPAPVPCIPPAGVKAAFFEMLLEFFCFIAERLRVKSDRPLLPLHTFQEPPRRRVISPGIDVSEFRKGSDFEREEPGKWRWAVVNGVPVKIKMP